MPSDMSVRKVGKGIFQKALRFSENDYNIEGSRWSKPSCVPMFLLNVQGSCRFIRRKSLKLVANDKSSLTTLAGPSANVVCSSAPLRWKGFSLAHCVIHPGEIERLEFKSHVLWLTVKPTTGEFSDAGGRFIEFSKPGGAITLVPAGMFPILRSRASMDFVMFSLESDFVTQLVLEAGCPVWEPRFRYGFRDQHLRCLMTLLKQEIQRGAPSGLLYSESLAHAIAIRLFLQGEQTWTQQTRAPGSRIPKRTFERITDRIEHDLHSDLSLQSLANEAGCSKSHFLTMFRATAGITPHQYLISRRIERAKLLLGKKKHGLIDIAQACGFSSQAHLAYTFKAKTGMTISEFRRL
jgi:AraC family transcriptional regulator